MKKKKKNKKILSFCWMLNCKYLIVSTMYKLLKIIKLNGLKNNRIKKRWKKDHNVYFLIAVII